MSAPDPGAAARHHPRPNAPLDDPMPGLGTTIPAGAPPEDEALGVEVPGPAAPSPAAGGAAPVVPPPGTPAGDPLPGGGTVVPVGRPPEDEALGVPVEGEGAGDRDR